MDHEEILRKTTNLTDAVDKSSVRWYEPAKVHPSFNREEGNILLGKLEEPRTTKLKELREKENRKRSKDSSAETINFYSTARIKPTFVDTRTKGDENRTVRIPENFPGVKLVGDYYDTESQTEEQPGSQLTLDDMEKVLSPRRDGKSGRVKNRNKEKLPRIKITKESERSTRTQPSSPSPRRASYHFNFTRMITELNEVCRMKDDTVVSQRESGQNLISLKTVQEARRYSVFTPRTSNDRARRHTRCRSLPNINIDGFPKRYFVKLDPLRASAIPVNLTARNDSSQRCRIVSENLRKLDERGIEPSESDQKALIGQWIRETTQVRLTHDD